MEPNGTIPRAWYDAPAFYLTNPYAVIGPRDTVPIAPGSTLFDLELEVAAIVGKAGTNLTAEEAEDHIAGYTIMIDWSARDLQRAELTLPLGPARAKDTATALGPVLVTPDDLAPARRGKSFNLAMTAATNGREIGHDALDSMAFSFGEMIAFASRGTWVKRGDVTPALAGAAAWPNSGADRALMRVHH